MSPAWCDILCCKHVLMPRNVTGKNRSISDRMCEWTVDIFIMLADPELFSSFGLLCSWNFFLLRWWGRLRTFPPKPRGRSHCRSVSPLILMPFSSFPDFWKMREVEIEVTLLWQFNNPSSYLKWKRMGWQTSLIAMENAYSTLPLHLLLYPLCLSYRQT